MKKTRETILMSDVFEELELIDCESLDENNSLYELVKEVQTDYDSEKGFVDKEIIFQRLLDGVHFKTDYTQFRHGGDNLKEQTAIEVFPHTKTIIEYKYIK